MKRFRERLLTRLVERHAISENLARKLTPPDSNRLVDQQLISPRTEEEARAVRDAR